MDLLAHHTNTENSLLLCARPCPCDSRKIMQKSYLHCYILKLEIFMEMFFVVAVFSSLFFVSRLVCARKFWPIFTYYCCCYCVVVCDTRPYHIPISSFSWICVYIGLHSIHVICLCEWVFVCCYLRKRKKKMCTHTVHGRQCFSVRGAVVIYCFIKINVRTKIFIWKYFSAHFIGWRHNMNVFFHS